MILVKLIKYSFIHVYPNTCELRTRVYPIPIIETIQSAEIAKMHIIFQTKKLALKVETDTELTPKSVLVFGFGVLFSVHNTKSSYSCNIDPHSKARQIISKSFIFFIDLQYSAGVFPVISHEPKISQPWRTSAQFFIDLQYPAAAFPMPSHEPNISQPW